MTARREAPLRFWPTPVSRGNDAGGPSGLKGGSWAKRMLVDAVGPDEARAMGCGRLNPEFTEALMGFPVGWTRLAD